jgi:hypothetical protein
MYEKKIVPVQVLNQFATEFIGEFVLIKGKFCTRRIDIEFYDKYGCPLLSRRFEISGLPVNENLICSPTFDYSSSDAKEMFDAQDKLIFEEIKNILGLTYYDDTYEINPKRTFSYIIYTTCNTASNDYLQENILN